MKTTIALTALFAAFIGGAVYDGTGPGQNCRITYDTSFNGLYLIKQQECSGRLGFPRHSRLIERRPLFTEF